MSAVEKTQLFPDAYPKQTAPTAKKPRERKILFALLWVAPAAITLALFVIYRFALSHVADNILTTVR